MKKIINFLPAIFATLFGILLINSCVKTSNQESPASSSPIVVKKDNNIKTDATTVCCEITCRKGSCKAYRSPCTCNCTLFGNPSCGGGLGKVYDDGELEISFNTQQRNSIQAAITYLENSSNPKANEAKNLFLNIKVIVDSTNGLIVTGQDITNYETYILQLETLAQNHFSNQEIEDIGNL